MRVFHLCAGNLFGGIKRFLVGFAQLPRTHGSADRRFLLTHEGRLLRELIAAGSTPFKTPVEPRISRPWTVVRAQAFVRKALAEIHPDAVISHGAWAHAVLGATFNGRIPRIFFLHGAASGHWLERLAALRPPTHSRQLALRLEGLVDDDGSRKSMSQEARRLYEREFDPVLCETRFSETLERVVHSSEVAGWA